MAGDDETGVTIHETVAELDAGPVAAQEAFPIGAGGRRRERSTRGAGEVAARLLDGVLADPAPHFAPQVGEPTYAEKIRSADRQLDLDRPAEELVRVVRALSPHIGARAVLEGRPVTVWRARVGDDGSFEPVEVQPDGGRRMSAEAWRRGLR